MEYVYDVLVLHSHNSMPKIQVCEEDGSGVHVLYTNTYTVSTVAKLRCYWYRLIEHAHYVRYTHAMYVYILQGIR